MDTWKIFTLGIVTLFSVSPGYTADIEVLDDRGRTVKIVEPAIRIISLAPHTTELLFAIGGGNRVVGTVQYSDYPQQAQAIARIGRADALDLEGIIDKHPDLIVAWASGNPAKSVQRLEQLGVPVFYSEPRNLEDIARNLIKLGQLIGNGNQANLVAETFIEQLGHLQSTYRNRTRLDVFYQIWDMPLITIGGNHLISKVIELCGGRNVFEDFTELAPKVSLEDVLIRNPEVLVIAANTKQATEWKSNWRLWKHVNAVQNNTFIIVDPDKLHRSTPRVLDGARALCVGMDKIRRQRSLK